MVTDLQMVSRRAVQTGSAREPELIPQRAARARHDCTNRMSDFAGIPYAGGISVVALVPIVRGVNHLPRLLRLANLEVKREAPSGLSDALCVLCIGVVRTIEAQ